MKKLAVLAIFVVFLTCFSGCRREGGNVKEAATADSNSLFPKFLAGTWQTTPTALMGWKLTLSPEGTVSSAIIPIMGVEIKPEQTTKVEMKDGSFSTFTAGNCPVEYNPVTRELTVVVNVEKLRLHFGDIINEGFTKDIIAGKVSEDGKTWVADWISLFNYGPDLPQDPNDAYQGIVTFEKISEWKGN